MKKKDLMKQILGITDTDSVFELEITGESGGDPARGIPTTKTVNKRRLASSHIVKKVREEWIVTGIAQAGDVVLMTAKSLTMSNQIEHDSINYDIVNQITAKQYTGTYFLYVLRRVLGQ